MILIELYKLYLNQLCVLYNKNEAEAILTILFESKGFSKIDIITRKELTIDHSSIDYFNRAIERLKKNEPLQYILGKTEFYNLPFYLNNNVLIPRPETEELVKWIIDENKYKTVKILDIGTGSGCIGISLSKNIIKSEVHVLDVSAEALTVAKSNADLNKTKITFLESDILLWKNYLAKDMSCGRCYANDLRYDIIVSNPPYIRNNEKELMHKNVLDFEPQIALFVDDNDPLLFYRTITEFASEYLKSSGELFFEINEAFGNEMIQLLEKHNFYNVILKKDIFGKDRFIKGTKS